MSWFSIFERRIVDALLKSPTFHRGVQRVHKTVHQIQHGEAPKYHNGGTNIDGEASKNGVGKLFEIFWDELKTGHKPEPKVKKK